MTAGTDLVWVLPESVEGQFKYLYPLGSLQLGMREEIEFPWTEESRELETSWYVSHGTDTWSHLSWAWQGLGLCAN